MKSKIIITLFSLILLINSCDENDNESIICTHVFIHGLEINLIEKGTTNSVNGYVKIIIEDDDYEEILESSEPNNSFYGAGERKGTYTLTITSNNYKTFVSEPIIVIADECHVKTVSKTFELELK
ncbi:hypothetical protein BW723_06575 [Polaribacter reichenbachii]|uniref:Uncharacterized protein n=1 Tax=Polaribacter reichenbachii TaxID=996801 RepID=A0A1B8U5Z5_9FLAO|nr:hypothetical protein [Polaribacter reichenbachii]APZ45977.1 hypothetical protein BW723_06575 [Polaribacter reichenbachii]AUC19839.1 hypothetical protein BTO17_14595 [Polaribacter reichenbachii]OBY67306.1 hypothetical protein LPB301_02915 [Polaribacter reichenbachii]